MPAIIKGGRYALFLVNLDKDDDLMKAYLLVTLLALSGLTLSAQTTVEGCATAPSPSWAAKLKSRAANLSAMESGKTSPIRVPYQIHLFTKSDSSSVLTLQKIYKELDTVNVFYANANMFLYECAPPELIADDSLYNFESAEEPVLWSQHYTSDVLNLYFPNTAKSGTTAVCGYSRYPPSVDVVIVAAACATNGSTLPHEIGHYFGLMHTHDSYLGAELADGSNCSFAGDLICDTPADPGLDYTNVSTACVYTGTVTDGNGAPYMPDVTNIMSYARKECRFYFSPMQYSVLNTTAQDERSYLYCSFGVGVKEYEGSSFSLFPNPGSESLSVTVAQEAEGSVFELYDALGSRILSTPLSKEFRLDTRSLVPGMYFYTLRLSGNSYSGKWLKN